MAYRGQGQKVQKVMVQPINLIFRYLQNRSQIQVWLYEQVNMRIEGYIIGFDEYMNLVLDDAEEIHCKTKSRKQLGRIMLKGDNITATKCLQLEMTSEVRNCRKGSTGFGGILCWFCSSETFVGVVVVTFMLFQNDNKWCCLVVFLLKKKNMNEIKGPHMGQ
ncbi:small nuclear ribonucleoprotein E-like [Nycticebus coucang]|uniref:small nuclear ribonucleoprotein E-like n=1 Tax=Nycticebus coucang TaxID=9470 RepID=UPI00234C5165|nr:small nuclear ribonucleoprotein E-like [Nycticebus coucang]